MTSTVRPALLAGLLAIAPSFPGLALATDNKPLVIVTSATQGPFAVQTGRRLRQLLINLLSGRGYDVVDRATSTQAAARRPGIEIRMDTNLQRIHGVYTTHALVDVTASMREAQSKRLLAHFNAQPEDRWRIPARCDDACLDILAINHVRPIADQLIVRIDKRLARHTAEKSAETAGHTVVFHHIDAGLLARIEQYLRYVAGIANIRRDGIAGSHALYRYEQIGSANATERSLAKMLHHLRLDARLRRVGNSFIVTVAQAARPQTHPRDW